MSSNTEPLGPPPPYEARHSQPSQSQQQPPPPQTGSQDTSHLTIPHKTSSIPPQYRRSMEDESRPLPSNWIRQFDDESHHQFYVDTSKSPPRSIWHHPYDDEIYMNSLSATEREEIEGLHRAHADADAGYSSEEHDYRGQHDTPLPPRQNAGMAGAEEPKGVHKLGRKMKDKLTSSTHTEREAARLKRDEEERKMYEQHQHIRRQMVKAAQTGEPQLLGKDRQGKEVWIEPPATGYGGYGGRGMGMGPGMGMGMGGGFGGRGYGYNPYASGMYGNPNARYLRPAGPYNRPYGGGYGGGMGLPLLGGLGGGMLLGGLMF